MHELTFLVRCATPALLGWACSASVAAAESSTQSAVTVSVDPANQHPISPFIYGINIASNFEGLPTGLTLDRLGGNRWTAYNWETNASNAGSDYNFQSDNSMGDPHQPGAAVSTLIAKDQKNGQATLMTVQMQGLVSGDADGPVNMTNPPDKSRFKKVVFEKKSLSAEPFTATPNTKDDSVYMDEFLWALDHKFAGQGIFGATPRTHPVFVSLDNEPELWKSTHREIQTSTGIGSDDYIARTIALATALKRQFPDLVIFGPAHYGFMGLYSWEKELNAASPAANNWFTDKYLKALKAAATSFGKPLVDVYDFHWYSEASDSAGARIVGLMGPNLNDDQVQAIVQSPRSLWDGTYREKSWISDVVGQPIALLPRLKSRIDAENPGMKLAVTEYDSGGGQHIAGTIAQADNLGVFGAQALFAANLWLLAPNQSYTLAGFRAFRNFDGANHQFGDVSVEATSSNIAKVAAYVSTDSTRAGRVVVVAINRSRSEQVTTITGQPLSGTAHLFQMTASTAARQSAIKPVAAGTQPVSVSSLTVTLPALSVTTIDIY